MTEPQPDFEHLIRQCFDDPTDVDTLTRFDASFRPYVLAVLMSLNTYDPSLTEDAYQTAFIKFIEIFRQGLKDNMNYAAYFVATAKNCLLDEIRRERRHVRLDDVVADEFASHEAEQTEARTVLLQAMSKLDRRCQFILERYYIMERDPNEIAVALGIKAASIHMAIKRCRDQLRAILDGC